MVEFAEELRPVTHSLGGKPFTSRDLLGGMSTVGTTNSGAIVGA